MGSDYDREREARDYVNRYVRVGWQDHIEPPRALLELLARAEAHGRAQAEVQVPARSAGASCRLALSSRGCGIATTAEC